MANPRRSPKVISTISITESERMTSGLDDFRIHLDHGEIHRWVPDSELVEDGWVVIEPTGGGVSGRFVLIRRPDNGADLTNANATITVGQKRWRRIPADTLSTNRTITLGTTNAAAG